MKNFFSLLLALLLSSLLNISWAETLLSISGQNIITPDKNKIIINGISLTNGVMTIMNPKKIMGSHYELSHKDYKNMQKLGINCARFEIQYYWLSKDNQKAFFEYMDQQIEMARIYNIYLILNLHFFGVFGSEQDDGFYHGDKHNRGYNLTRFWKVISDRYKYETQIAAYDLINEPNCHENFKESDLYRTYYKLIKTIRNNNDQHILIVADPVQKFAHRQEHYHDLKEPFQKIHDQNIMYTYHWYEPWTFTHQSMAPRQGLQINTSYPYTKYKYTYSSGYYDTPHLSRTKKNNWQLYQTSWIDLFRKNTNPQNMFSVELFAADINTTVYFDDIKLEKINKKTKKITTITIPNADIKTPRGYSGWEERTKSDTPSNWTFLHDKESSGIDALWIKKADHTGNKSGSLMIDGTYADWSDNSWSIWTLAGDSQPTLFKIEKDYKYRASAWIKIKKPTKSNIGIHFPFFSTRKIYINKDYIKKSISSYYDRWAKKHNVPLFCGEFGLTDPSNIKGESTTFSSRHQIKWIDDMTAVLNQLNHNWSYHCYKDYYGTPNQFWGDWFGLFDKNVENTPLQGALRRGIRKDN